MATESFRLDRSTVVALGAMALGIFVVANDFTALGVAIPTIETDLDTTLNRTTWVVNAYTVVFAMSIVTGGRLADMYGRRRLFAIGAAIFGTFSLLGGLAPSIEILIACRACMGVGGALMWPSVMGMTYALLPDEKAGLAGGLVIGVAGLGNATGPLTAGFLTDTFSWRWVFFLNVPIALVAIIVTLRYVHESAGGARERLDYQGIAALSAALVLILVALDIGGQNGFSTSVAVMLAAGLLLVAFFVGIERRQGSAALIPRRVISRRTFAASVAAVLLMSWTLFAIIVYIPQYLEKNLGWSALAAGAGLLPLMLVFAVASFIAGPLYNVLGSRLVVSVGAACLALGAVWLGLSIGSGFGALVPGLALAGVGVGIFFSAITTVSVTSVDDADQSLASAIVYMANVGGGAVGLGVNTAIVVSAATLVDGIRTAFFVDAALAVAGAIIAISLGHGEAGRYHPRLHRHHRAHG